MASHFHHPGHHSESGNCSMDHVDWAWDIFHECVTDNVQYAGFMLGLLSILCWMFVFIPQFVLSFRSGNLDDAVSPFFLISWLLGDLSNLIGCLLTHQLGTQIATAYYYIVMDVLILMQYLYYVITNRRKRRLRLDSVVSNGSAPTPKDYNSIPARKEPNHVVYCVGGLYLFTCLYSVQSFGSSKTELHSSRSVGRSLLSVTQGPSAGDEDCRVYFGDTGECLFQDEIELIGYCIGSFSGLFYLGSRLPQIIRNFQRKSVEGLSLLMFILTVLGNTLYGMSILMEDLQPVFIVAHMPWLIGSIGTLTFDCCLLVQFALYHGNRYVKEETEDEEEARRLLNSGVPSESINSAIYS
ncbi:lysosomal amino acid transporter 1 homolog [Amphiura filiformis]|uniref:lysosomal amino acid transporter 1 homolog n=1 Tax=Amphiura filiformis TaxID=82378 RepID=UPI003B219890